MPERWLRYALGFAAALIMVLALGEAYARLYTPNDVRAKLGDVPSGGGIYKPDPVLGADYRSYEDFRAENAGRLKQLGALDSPTPTWLFLGNSFVQAEGMLADTARKALPDTRIFNLGRNVDLPLRVAQTRLLLEAGLRPRRIFFVLLTNDVAFVGSRPLSFIAVSPEGAITTRVRWPEPPWDALPNRSRLATIAWMRSRRSAGDPSFRGRNVADTPSPRIQQDLHSILSVLADVARHHDVPVTVVAIPNRQQVFGRTGTGFQQTLKDICHSLKLDLYDTFQPLADDQDKRTLFLPDWHFSPRGNEILLRGLMEHLETTSAGARISATTP